MDGVLGVDGAVYFGGGCEKVQEGVSAGSGLYLLCPFNLGITLLPATNMCYRVIATVAPMQNPTGGFGGGFGQMSHCAGSYAAVLSLAMVGGEEAYKLVDRVAL